MRERSKISGFNSLSLDRHNGNCPQFPISWKYRGNYNFSITLPTPPGDHNQRSCLEYMRAHLRVAAHQSRKWARGLKVRSGPMAGRMEGVRLVCRCSKPPETNQFKEHYGQTSGRCRNWEAGNGWILSHEVSAWGIFTSSQIEGGTGWVWGVWVSTKV